MPARELEKPFAELCVRAGVDIRRGIVIPGLSGRGHFDFEPTDSAGEEARSDLQQIFDALGGDHGAMEAKAPRPLKPDFVLPASRHVLELDEVQHFSTARSKTLEHYSRPENSLFDVDEYRKLCRRHHPQADKAFAHKQAAEFPGPQGRQRQRAYLDAVRDLMIPALGLVGVFRVPVPDRDLRRGFEQLQQNPAWPYWQRLT